MSKNTTWLAAILLLFSPLFIAAQTGAISGQIIDAKFAETLIGCSVKLDADGGGSVTDIDGRFMIRNVSAGKHKITINYTGYQPKTIEDIEVRAGETTLVDVILEEAGAMIAEVVVVAKAQRESMSALTILQKNSAVIADGISAETIRRTPDRTTGDVIRRVSGASIQDGGFAVIRGLTDRYNVALLNGVPLPSTEPDRKAFSFDLFPSSFIDNLMVMKTASADMPGEFAGGAILLNTRDIPEENYLKVSVSSGYNTQTTFKEHWSTPGSSTDWLGIDNGTRAFPSFFPAQKTDYLALSKTERVALSKQFTNDWNFARNSSAAPNGSFQIASGFLSRSDRRVKAGATVALSYSNSQRLTNAERADFDLDGQLFDYRDETFQNNVLWGALWNSALQIGPRNKISLNSIYSTTSSNTNIYRTGQRLKDNDGEVLATSNEFTQNQLLNTRLGGEHLLGERGIKLNWGAGISNTQRNVPSLRRMEYSRPFAAEGEEPEPFRAFIPQGSGSLDYGGRFYADLNEKAWNGTVDAVFPFAISGIKQSVKVGALTQSKRRTFDARVLGVIKNRVSGFDQSLLTLPMGEIFAPENFKETGFVLDEITNPSDQYDAQADLNAAYVQFDNKIAEKLRLTWGVRMENFSQRLQSIDYTNAPVDVNKTVLNMLPSLNLTYSLNDKNQLRFSASQTVTRPEFREIAPFSFYDFNLNAAILGNPKLEPGKIANIDLRYELYPGSNQLFSVSAFAKKFDNPIEFAFFSQGAGTRTFTFQNLPSATTYGIETEIRKNLGFIIPNGENWVVFSNLAILHSKLDFKGIGYYDAKRPLQGQSPYVFNAGLTYQAPFGLSSTVVFNMIGDRISQVGTADPNTGEGYADIYERRRQLLDLSVSQRIARHGEVKLTLSDLLRPDFIFYQDNNRNHKYDEANDNIMQRVHVGTTASLSFSWKF